MLLLHQPLVIHTSLCIAAHHAELLSSMHPITIGCRQSWHRVWHTAQGLTLALALTVTDPAIIRPSVDLMAASDAASESVTDTDTDRWDGAAAAPSHR